MRAYYLAGKLRESGWDIPSHIPNYARILDTDVRYEQRTIEGRITSTISVPYCPTEKFQWYRPKQVCTRPLVSRNKREGLYCGKRDGHYRLAPKHFHSAKSVKTLEDRRIIYAYIDD